MVFWTVWPLIEKRKEQLTLGFAAPKGQQDGHTVVIIVKQQIQGSPSHPQSISKIYQTVSMNMYSTVIQSTGFG